jgi:hypothetical protein
MRGLEPPEAGTAAPFSSPIGGPLSTVILLHLWVRQSQPPPALIGQVNMACSIRLPALGSL